MGFATARAFAEAGAAVVIADINETTLGTATDEPTAAGHHVLGVRCDVSDEDSVAAMVKATVDTFGRLDMAFNNAGIQVPPSDAADEPAEIFDRVNAINLRGVWACMKHELGQMRTQGSGAIVNCSSLGGLVGLPGRAAYHASKHGDRADHQRRPGVRAPRDPHQRRLPRHHRDPDGRRHDRQGRTRPGRGCRRDTDRPPRPRRGNRCIRSVALQPRRQPSSASPSPSTAATPLNERGGPPAAAVGGFRQSLWRCHTRSRWAVWWHSLVRPRLRLHSLLRQHEAAQAAPAGLRQKDIAERPGRSPSAVWHCLHRLGLV